VGLVLGYGFGIAATLMLAGLLLVRLRERLDELTRGSRFRLAGRYLRAVPALTALLVLVVGLGLVFRALGTPV
jgi:nickel/cobalt exporter